MRVELAVKVFILPTVKNRILCILKLCGGSPRHPVHENMKENINRWPYPAGFMFVHQNSLFLLSIHLQGLSKNYKK